MLVIKQFKKGKKMYCEVYRKLNCVGCPQYYKDYCEGIKQGMKAYRHAIHKKRSYFTYMAIMPIVMESENAELTSTEILDRIRNLTGRKIKTNIFYVNQVMQKMYKYKKIKGKIYYFAKIVELDY